MPNLIDAVPGVSQAKLIVGGIIAAVILVAIVSLGFYIWGLNNTIDSLEVDKKRLEADNATLTTNVDTVKNNFKVCEDSNIIQQNTVDSLKKERKDNEEAVAALAKAEQVNQTTITNLKRKLAILNADAANNGPLAKNLKETIRSIQNKESLE